MTAPSEGRRIYTPEQVPLLPIAKRLFEGITALGEWNMDHFLGGDDTWAVRQAATYGRAFGGSLVLGGSSVLERLGQRPREYECTPQINDFILKILRGLGGRMEYIEDAYHFSDHLWALAFGVNPANAMAVAHSAEDATAWLSREIPEAIQEIKKMRAMELMPFLEKWARPGGAFILIVNDPEKEDFVIADRSLDRYMVRDEWDRRLAAFLP